MVYEHEGSASHELLSITHVQWRTLEGFPATHTSVRKRWLPPHQLLKGRVMFPGLESLAWVFHETAPRRDGKSIFDQLPAGSDVIFADEHRPVPSLLARYTAGARHRTTEPIRACLSSCCLRHAGYGARRTHSG